MSYVLVETVGNGSVLVQQTGNVAQIIVEVGVGQLTNAQFLALLAAKQDVFGGSDSDGQYLRFNMDGSWYFDDGYVHPAETPLNLTSESGKAIKSLQTNALGHVENATKGTVDTAADPLEIVDTDSYDLLVGDKTSHRIMVVHYGAQSGSIPQYGDIWFFNTAGTISYMPATKKSITGVTLAKYEDGNDIYLRITNNSGDTLFFEYSLIQYDIL